MASVSIDGWWRPSKAQLRYLEQVTLKPIPPSLPLYVLRTLLSIIHTPNSSAGAATVQVLFGP